MLGLFLRRRKDLQTMGSTDLIAGQSVGLQVGGALVEFPAVPETDAVYHQVVMRMLGIHMGGHQHLEVRELPLGQLQPDGVDFLGRQTVLRTKGLDEVVVLPPVCFPEPLLGKPHLGVSAPGSAVPAGDQLPALPHGFLLLLGVAQHAAQSAAAAATIFDCGEGCHLVDTSSISFASSLIG